MYGFILIITPDRKALFSEFVPSTFNPDDTQVDNVPGRLCFASVGVAVPPKARAGLIRWKKMPWEMIILENLYR